VRLIRLLAYTISYLLLNFSACYYELRPIFKIALSTRMCCFLLLCSPPLLDALIYLQHLYLLGEKVGISSLAASAAGRLAAPRTLAYAGPGVASKAYKHLAASRRYGGVFTLSRQKATFAALQEACDVALGVKSAAAAVRDPRGTPSYRLLRTRAHCSLSRAAS